MDAATLKKIVDTMNEHDCFYKSEIKGEVSKGLVAYDYTKKHEYKRLDPSKAYFSDEIELSKEYEEALMKHFHKIKRFFP